ncbi:MAG: hypothetical protein JW837_08040 [Sedimentisphaerales bacterium]|nr:hypothetical protein [Sedimentisphaerales bacterium]
MEPDNYASHLHVFEKVFETFEIKKALEFGMGKFSTPFLVGRANVVVSVEQESKEWYERIKKQINSSNWKPVFQSDPQIVFEQFDAENKDFDLVFSDGAAQTRCLVANLAMERNIPVVILHDTEKVWYYRWNLLRIPPDYARFNFRHKGGASKVTSVLTKSNQDILEQWDIPEHDRILQAYSSPCQPVIELDFRIYQSSGICWKV